MSSFLLSPAFSKKSGGTLFSAFRSAWFRIFSRYLVPSTPPTVFGQSFWNFTGALRMVWRFACGFFRILKLFFYHFFLIFNLDIFWAPILQKCIGSRYLVPSAPPTVFGQSFWNFTNALRMVWRYACVFFQNHEIIFYHFFRIFNVDIFWALILQKCIGSRYLVPSTPPTVFGQSFWNFTEAFRMVWRYACGVFIILKVFLITFSAFLALLYVELISQGESPASVREYVSTWVRQYVHKHFLVIASPPNFM